MYSIFPFFLLLHYNIRRDKPSAIYYFNFNALIVVLMRSLDVGSDAFFLFVQLFFVIRVHLLHHRSDLFAAHFPTNERQRDADGFV